MKKSAGIILIIICLLAVSGYGAYKYVEYNLEALAAVGFLDLDVSKIQDGSYRGSYSAFPVTAEVLVAVKEQKIADIRLIKHLNGQGTPAEIITDRVVETQSLRVDIISGATYSSKVILKAVEDALKNAPAK